MSFRARFTLTLIITGLLLPGLLALALYLGGWRPAVEVRGELIQPPKPIELIDETAGHWSLVLLSDAPCGDPCVRRLDELRRLRVSLGSDKDRTRVVWLGAGIAGEAAAMFPHWHGITVVDRKKRVNSKWPPGSLLIVDPQGRAMLRYPPDVPLQYVQDDLMRLLKTTRAV